MKKKKGISISLLILFVLLLLLIMYVYDVYSNKLTVKEMIIEDFNDLITYTKCNNSLKTNCNIFAIV